MAKIIALVNQKGGTGKTTTSLNLASYLALSGKYILLVDLDAQGNATAGIGFRPEVLKYTLYHSLVSGILPEDVIQNTGLLNYDIFPSSSDLAGANIELITKPDREFFLKEILKRISKNYDYILIDSPPSLGLLTINGLVAADEIIIPVQCEYFALEGIGQLLRTIDLVNDNLDTQTKIKGALLTMHDRHKQLSRAVEKEVRRNFPGYVFETVIPRNVNLAEAPSFGQAISQFKPDCKGARAYKQLAEEFLKLEETKF